MTKKTVTVRGRIHWKSAREVAHDKRRKGKVSIGALFNMQEAMRNEKRNWRYGPCPGGFRADNRHDFTTYPFDTFADAESFVEQKVIAAGLATLGLTVEKLP